MKTFLTGLFSLLLVTAISQETVETTVEEEVNPETEKLFNLVTNVSAASSIISVEFMMRIEEQLREQQEEMRRILEEMDSTGTDFEEEMSFMFFDFDKDYDYVCMYQTSKENVELNSEKLDELFTLLVTTEGWDDVINGFEALPFPEGLPALTDNLSYGQIKNWVDLFTVALDEEGDGREEGSEWKTFTDELENFFEGEALKAYGEHLKDRVSEEELEEKFEGVFREIFPHGLGTLQNCGY